MANTDAGVEPFFLGRLDGRLAGAGLLARDNETGKLGIARGQFTSQRMVRGDGHERSAEQRIVAGGVDLQFARAAGGHRSFTAETRPKFCERIGIGFSSWSLVAFDDRITATTLDGYRDDFIGEFACLLCGGGAAVALHGAGVLVFTRHVMLLCNIFSTITHVLIFKRAPESIMDHRIDRFAIAEFPTFPRAEQQMRCATHVFHASCDDHLCIA